MGGLLFVVLLAVVGYVVFRSVDNETCRNLGFIGKLILGILFFGSILAISMSIK